MYGLVQVGARFGVQFVFGAGFGSGLGSVRCSYSIRCLLRFTQAIKCREFRGVSYINVRNRISVL